MTSYLMSLLTLNTTRGAVRPTGMEGVTIKPHF